MGNIKNRKYLSWLFVFVLVFSLVSGSTSAEVMAKGSKTNTIKFVSLSIGNKKVTKKTYKMKQGEKKKLKVAVSPKKGKKSIKYATSNKKVATVSKSGTITAKKAGTAKIKVTVKAGKAKKTTWMKVRVIKPSGTDKNTTTEQPDVTQTPNVTETPSETEQPDVTQTPDIIEPPSVTENPVQTPEPTKTPDIPTGKKSIVVYFSCTDNTKTIAEYIAESIDADVYRIEPAVPYNSADLNYGNADSRTSKEQNDMAARPEIAGELPVLDGYENVYTGYPIWWGQAPKILYTFVENCNLSGKTVIPFCTSASSGIGTSAANLQAADTSQATWLAGQRFSGSSPKSDVESWILGLGLQ